MIGAERRRPGRRARDQEEPSVAKSIEPVAKSIEPLELADRLARIEERQIGNRWLISLFFAPVVISLASLITAIIAATGRG